MFKGIKLKMTAAIVAAVLVTAAALTVITSFLVAYTFKLSLKSHADETSKILAEAIAGRERPLAVRAEVVAGDGDFQTAYSFRVNELEALHKDLAERIAKASVSLGAVVELDGKLITSVEAKGQTAKASALAQSLALKKVRETDQTQTTVERFGGRTFFVTAVPIKRYGQQTLGYLAFASQFDDKLLGQLKEASGADILVVADAAVESGTATLDRGQSALASLSSRLGGQETLAEVEGLASAGEPLLAWALPLRAGGKLQAALVFALSAKDANALQARILRVSLGLALLTTLVSGLLGLLIARRVADPIVEIEHGFREIAASGDLSRRIGKSYPDEVGRLVDSFNYMQNQVEQLHARVVTAEQRMRDELKMASVVQEMLLPTTTVDGTRCQWASHSQPSTETGGDWFTIIHSPEQLTTTAVIADVTGHGAPAALVTAILHGFFKASHDRIANLSFDNWQPTIDEILRTLNRTVIEATRGTLTSSLSLLTFDHRTLAARYVNAGHHAAVLVTAQQVVTVSCPPSSMIGDIEQPNFTWGELKMSPQQLILLYTDGLIECTNTAQEMYGFKRLRKLLGSVANRDARSVRDLIVENAAAFYGDMPRADDITVIVGSVR